MRERYRQFCLQTRSIIIPVIFPSFLITCLSFYNILHCHFPVITHLGLLHLDVLELIIFVLEARNAAVLVLFQQRLVLEGKDDGIARLEGCRAVCHLRYAVQCRVHDSRGVD